MDRRARILQGFAPLLTLAAERGQLTADLGVAPFPADHAVPGRAATTLSGEELLDAVDEAEETTQVDWSSDLFGFFYSGAGP
ncbi:MAG TPA: hypothetical protein VF030_07880 [Solirubrobacterales bacterium]